MAPSEDTRFPMKGSCGCGAVTYTLHARPMWIHCCHCTECQVQTGSAFVLNGLIEHSLLTHDDPASAATPAPAPISAAVPGSETRAKQPEPQPPPPGVEMVPMPAAGEGGQTVARCARCHTALWSNYATGPLLRFVRLGTLDKDPTGKDPLRGQLEPDVHIYTSNKVPWVTIPPDKLAFEEFYDLEKAWTPQAWERFRTLMGRGKEWKGEETEKGGAEEPPSEVLQNLSI